MTLIVIIYFFIEFLFFITSGNFLFTILFFRYRIKKWVSKNLPDTWDWEIQHIFVEFNKFTLIGKIKDINNLDFKNYNISNNIYTYPSQLLSPGFIYLKIDHLFGIPTNYEKLIKIIETSDKTYITFKRDKKIESLLQNN